MEIKRADEARKETSRIINEYATRRMEQISVKINEAIRSGKYSISESGSLDSQTKERLECLGYSVEVGSQYNESYYSISWK